MSQAENLQHLRRQASHCRELAEKASDDEAAAALHDTANCIDAALQALEGSGSTNEGIEA